MMTLTITGPVTPDEDVLQDLMSEVAGQIADGEHEGEIVLVSFDGDRAQYSYKLELKNADTN